VKCTSRRAQIALVAAVILAGGLVRPVHAGKRKVVRAKINGRPFRVGGRLAIGSTNGLGVIITASKISLQARSQKSLTLGCSIPGLSATMPVPVTVPCGDAYVELRVGAHAVNRAWAPADQIQLTVLSFDGTRLKGTFVGQLEQAGEQNPSDPPAPVEKGKVSVDLLGG
jgi:hypothetical protein